VRGAIDGFGEVRDIGALSEGEFQAAKRKLPGL
jgi:hypothetical protein